MQHYVFNQAKMLRVHDFPGFDDVFAKFSPTESKANDAIPISSATICLMPIANSRAVCILAAGRWYTCSLVLPHRRLTNASKSKVAMTEAVVPRVSKSQRLVETANTEERS